MVKYHFERLDAVIDFTIDMSKESERGCALIAASLLDFELQIMLEKFFVHDPKIFKDFFGRSGGGGSFSSKIDIAYLLGIISEPIFKDLHQIRGIRNEFGHSHDEISFKFRKVIDKCKNMSHWPIDKHEKDVDVRDVYMKTAQYSLLYILIAVNVKNKCSFDEAAFKVEEANAAKELVPIINGIELSVRKIKGI